MKNLTSRKWVFTSFMMSLNWEEIYEDWSDLIRFIIIGTEICPKTKKEHFQGYVQFFEPCRMRKFQRMIGDNCHLESQRGNDFQASDYCKKDGKYITFGKPSTQGARNEMESLCKMIDDGKRHSECYKEHKMSYLRYRHHFDKYRENVMFEKAKKWRDVKVEILSGPTRCGKTRKYLYDHDGNYNNDVFLIHCSHDDKLWFDGYEGQKILILDEFRNDIKLGFMLGLLEGHLQRLPIKGSHVYALWDKVVITTNLKKNEIFPNISSNLIAPFWSRVSEFVNMYECPEVTKGNTVALVTGVTEGFSGSGFSWQGAGKDFPGFTRNLDIFDRNRDCVL